MTNPHLISRKYTHEATVGQTQTRLDVSPASTNVWHLSFVVGMHSGSAQPRICCAGGFRLQHEETGGCLCICLLASVAASNTIIAGRVAPWSSSGIAWLAGSITPQNNARYKHKVLQCKKPKGDAKVDHTADQVTTASEHNER